MTASGDEVRSVIAGYHWFTDWGRDTMISLEGLALLTGRHVEAGYILRTFAHDIRDGLIPNLFPETGREGLYHTADATLWFFHALSRYLDYTNDRATLRLLPPRLRDIVDHHLHGTRFWHEDGRYLYDVIDGPDGDDSSCRPNQLFAFTLEYPVLDESRWKPVLQTVERELLTPVGLRSLSPGHPDFKPKYDGDLRVRDAAYHQGTVWAWLIGPFVNAWLRVYPDNCAKARRFLAAFNAHLNEACVGAISEVFDAEPPYTPRGCIAQAWSVAEVLRTWAKTAAVDCAAAADSAGVNRAEPSPA